MMMHKVKDITAMLALALCVIVHYEFKRLDKLLHLLVGTYRDP